MCISVSRGSREQERPPWFSTQTVKSRLPRVYIESGLQFISTKKKKKPYKNSNISKFCSSPRESDQIHLHLNTYWVSHKLFGLSLL